MIEYENIKLVPIEIEDIDKLNKWKNNKEIFKYLGGGYHPTSISQQKKWMEKMTENTPENRRYLIQDDNDEKVGFIGLYEISSIHRTCSLGLYIGEQNCWGKGIATKAYKAIEEYAKNFLNIRKIRLEVVKDNERAVKLYEKLGFEICGEYKQERFIEGQYRNVILMEKFI